MSGFCNFILSNNPKWGGQGENEEEERAKEKKKLDQEKDQLWNWFFKNQFDLKSKLVSIRNFVKTWPIALWYLVFTSFHTPLRRSYNLSVLSTATSFKNMF